MARQDNVVLRTVIKMPRRFPFRVGDQWIIVPKPDKSEYMSQVRALNKLAKGYEGDPLYAAIFLNSCIPEANCLVNQQMIRKKGVPFMEQIKLTRLRGSLNLEQVACN
jgi:hypothetical protein